ncbi:hypothetical protein M378DRAFT_185199 [Amanita muscaria Koide BX008]|uniref:AB hydrolase-1 domain-containing protein n=1 Tax=Amanita muscaria (strain Koide BX008) TaxID=946122 RepID=A0A0C2X1Z8_AMAMK|nr:hypothetical protein M378DRAFT_185199 [Amanita muscaria Koide BX008]
MIHVEDKSLSLPDGRILAYADNGNTSSLTVVLYLHGVFSVGDASRLSPTLLQKNVHLVVPSLHGWGRSSPVPDLRVYATTLAADITALITHLHPEQQHLKLYICAHCFGTVVAQILAGLDYETFPLGRHIVSMLLISPFSPPHCHRDYSKNMSWKTFFFAGPPSRYVPYSLLHRIARYLITTKINSVTATEAAVRDLLFNHMSDEEAELFLRWKEDHGIEEGELEANITRNVIKSVAQSWRGFFDVATTYHTEYQWRMGAEGEQARQKPYIHILSSTDDPIAPVAMAQWLATAYGKSASLKIVKGGRMAALFHLDELWRQIIE